jgi:catalase-peroxidase
MGREECEATILDAFDKSKGGCRRCSRPTRMDPVYEKISRRFMEHLISSRTRSGVSAVTHRDMGPRARYFPRRSPLRAHLAGPDPDVDQLIDDKDVAALKAKICVGTRRSQLVSTA